MLNVLGYNTLAVAKRQLSLAKGDSVFFKVELIFAFIPFKLHTYNYIDDCIEKQ